MKKRLLRKNKIVLKVFDYIKEHPIISIKETAMALGLSYNGVSNAIKKLSEVGILNEITTKARDRLFEYSEYINIFKENT